ncbi:MAG TPA: GNAT family N-acetyltransferase [Burkholderiaceae bacterium]|jgi:ribosomal protein S18 acetylase RimI-like enzyme|nr:GNAT family N-acetyltransferase [Burkholderiaceae bacterium]
MLIRKLNEVDAEAFKAMRLAAVENSPLSFYPSVADLNGTSMAGFRAQLNTETGNTVFGAWMNDELVGIVGLRRDGREKLRHKATVWGVYTVSSCRGQGVARQLMSVALEEAKSHPEIVGVNLSVITNNHAAKALYASFGFRSWGIERNAIQVNGEFVDEEHMRLAFDAR